MKNKIYFIGGAKGVGKSSLLNSKHIMNKGLEIVNTGDFFNRANKIYNNNVKENAKEDMLDYLINNSPLIADTHYAGFLNGIYSGKFERGLYEEELNFLDHNSELELILITLDPQIALERRKQDIRNQRDLNYDNLKKEIEANQLYFAEYCSQLQKKRTVIENIDYDISVKNLNKIITPFLF
jgi:adenylate kinase|tara:strand:+ start:330 stop:875 length:546 start_codon:yes stop_codon:yes gene_type:complete